MEAWYQIRFRAEMLWVSIVVAFMLMLFAGPPLLLPIAVPSPITTPWLAELQRRGLGVLTVLALACAFVNLLVIAVTRQRIRGLDMCTSGFLSRQMTVVLVATQFARRQQTWPLPTGVERTSAGRALLLFVPGLIVLQVVAAFLAPPCLAMWLWVFITGIVPKWWTRAMTPVVLWIDRMAYQVLMGTTRESRPLALDPPTYLRRARRALPGHESARNDEESLPLPGPTGQAAGPRDANGAGST